MKDEMKKQQENDLHNKSIENTQQTDIQTYTYEHMDARNAQNKKITHTHIYIYIRISKKINKYKKCKYTYTHICRKEENIDA